MSIPWWAWIIVGVIAFLAYGIRAAGVYRAQLRRDLIEFLHEKRPDLRTGEVTSESVELLDEHGNNAGAFFFHRLYREAPRNEAEKSALFERLLASLTEGEQVQDLGPEHRERVMPRVLSAPQLASMRREVPFDLPSVDLGVDGLRIVFVLDNENSVAYLGADELALLDLTSESALALAKANLAKHFDPELVRQAASGRNLQVVKSFDSYDAARLLLIPEHLHEGETLVALIPDRDTLALTQAPPDGDWSSLRKLARNAAGDPLYTKPLVVTAAGFSAAPV